MIEAMKQALEALETYHGYMEPLTTVFGGPRVPAEQSTTGKVESAIASLRQAIAELESQEPVAWLEPEWGEKICPEVGYEATMTDDHPRDLCWIPLYPHPPQRTWVGLTGDDWKQITRKANYHWEMTTSEYAERIGELTEAKLKEKNA
jgi:hypothetical protein